MNERIKELEKQCWNHQTNHLDSEKFAELIIEECIDVVKQDWYTPDGHGTVLGQTKAVQFIKEHFGIN